MTEIIVKSQDGTELKFPLKKKLLSDLKHKRGYFYEPIPTKDYLPQNYKDFVDSYILKNPVFHYRKLYSALCRLDSENPVAHSVVSHYLKSINYTKSSLFLPDGKQVQVWSKA